MATRGALGPAGICIAAGGLVWFGWERLPTLGRGDNAVADLRSAMNTLASIDATMLGFLVATGALIFAVAQTTIVRNLYRTGHVPRLLGALFLDSALFLAGMVLSLLGVLSASPSIELLRAVAAVNAAAMAGLLVVGHTMWHLLINVGPPRNTPLELP